MNMILCIDIIHLFRFPLLQIRDDRISLQGNICLEVGGSFRIWVGIWKAGKVKFDTTHKIATAEDP